MSIRVNWAAILWVIGSMIVLLLGLAGMQGCATTGQEQTTPQAAEQKADEIGPLEADAIQVILFQIGATPVVASSAGGQPAAPPVAGAIEIGTITITVTSSNTQQGSTEQAADQVLTTGDTDADSATETSPDVDLTIPVP